MAENIFPPKIKFYQNHSPQMATGTYSIVIDHTVSHGKITKDNQRTFTQSFAIFGERYALKDQDIQSVFPAPGSTGEYANILPHLILERNTLPWERRANSNKDLPWLALLLFDESETPEKKVIQVKDLGTTANGGGFFPVLPTDIMNSNEGEQNITVIDVSKTILQKILPNTDSLLLMAHTRQGVGINGELVGEENAVLFCNRLPEQGKRSTVHLVSLEGRYNDKDFDHKSGNLFRLVSLKSWEFYTIEHFKITSEVLKKLQEPGQASADDVQKLSTLLDREFAGTETQFTQEITDILGINVNNFKKTLIDNAKFDKTFEGLLLNLNKDQLTLQLPPGTSVAANTFLSQGLIPLVHHFRNGDRSVSWYRGPFLPYRPDVATAGATVRNLFPETGDELLQFDSNLGMFDVTYAAAWEIGRLLALSSKDFSVSLFQWKRLIAQHEHKASQQNSLGHLPIFAHSHNHEQEKPLWEKHLQPWLLQLSTFQNIPANYLLPNEALLPKESIRFFYVDKNWQIAALSGAFSIGGEWDKESQSDDNDFNDFLKLEDNYVMGFLLRSDVVDGWPGLLMNGVDKAGNEIKPLIRKLSTSILCCLFKTEIKQVIFYQKPELMHFGLTKLNDNFYKKVRNEDGAEIGTDILLDKQIDKNTRVINVASLAQALGKQNNPAQFAMNMIEGVPKVIFNVS